jgi:hypothetical protein
LTVATVVLPDSVAPADRASRRDALLDAAARVPGVRQAAASFMTPLSGWSTSMGVERPGLESAAPNVRYLQVAGNDVSAGWFGLYGLPILAGREFDARDRVGSERVIVVNQRFVEAFFGRGVDPIGRRVRGRFATSEVEPYTVVGVVGDALYQSARRGRPPTVYSPMAQEESVSGSFSLTLDTPGATSELRRAIDTALATAVPGASVSSRSIDDQIRATVQQERLLSVVAGSFGVLAAGLAGLGLYGVASYSVSRRRSEIAIRMALGSSVAGVVRLLLRRVAALIAEGAVAGTLLSLWATALIQPLLFALTPHDPATLAGASAVLALVGLGAGWLPARRAARLDPTMVLKG